MKQCAAFPIDIDTAKGVENVIFSLLGPTILKQIVESLYNIL